MKRIAIALAVMLCASSVFATALTAERDTPSRAGKSIVLGVLSNTRIFAGSMVAISNQYARSASDSPAEQVVGRCAETVDNRTNADGAGTSGVKSVEVDIGIFRWANGSSFTDAHIGDFAYVLDDQTVMGSGATNDIVAGVIVDVDSSGVWVRTGNVADKALAGTTLTVSGATALNGKTAISGGGGFDTIPFTNSSAGTHSALNAFALDVEIDDKYALVGPDGTTGIMIQAGQDTAVQGTGSVSFGVAFDNAATPFVTITSMQSGTGTFTNEAYVFNVTSSLFDYAIDATTGTIYWAAYGARP